MKSLAVILTGQTHRTDKTHLHQLVVTETGCTMVNQQLARQREERSSGLVR